MPQALDDSTICALATPQGRGAIAVVRISGPLALNAAAGLLDGPKREEVLSAAGYSLHYAEIKDKGVTLDQVLISVFRAPHSYTGEDSVEISCHCSHYIVSELLGMLYSEGVQLAEPGEFTKRAFLNGKMDLAQAESVADLIESETSAAHRLAMNQMKGGFSKELSAMRGQMLKIVSLMELELDFSEEEVQFADRKELAELIDNVTSRIDSLISGFRLGNAIKSGVPVAIVGATNTGKSTLLNLLLGEERAIVSPVPGTTRDSIEDTVNIGGTLFRFIDTAGIRTSDDIIEKIGIQRTYDKINLADTVILMLDAGHPESFEVSLRSLAGRLGSGTSAPGASVSSTTAAGGPDLSSEKKVIVALNKCDLVEAGQFEGDSPSLPASVRAAAAHADLHLSAILPMSALKAQGIDALRLTLTQLQPDLNSAQDVTLVTNVRHLQALRSARAALARVRAGLAANLSTDLLTQDLREALYYIGAIVGEVSSQEVLNEIFGRFCIGK